LSLQVMASGIAWSIGLENLDGISWLVCGNTSA